jgi:hypothetical protein
MDKKELIYPELSYKIIGIAFKVYPAPFLKTPQLAVVG